MTQDPFVGILDPFAWWNIAGTYSRYAGFFDLVIYCSLFIALANAVFVKRFAGRPGKALATVIGLMLGISLTVTEQKFGWSLSKAGPIALLILIILLGCVLLQTMFKLHVKWRLAAPLTFVIIYLFMRAATPAAISAISEEVPFLNLLAAAIFLLCVWQVGAALWPGRSGKSAGVADDSGFIASLDRRREEKELKVERDIKRRMTPFAKRETRRTRAGLSTLLAEVEKEKPDWNAVSRELAAAGNKGGEVLKAIERIRLLDQRLEKFDWRELRDLSAYYREFSDEDKAKLKEQILLERRKIVQEHVVLQLAKRCVERQRQIQQLLEEAFGAVSKQDRSATVRAVSRIMALETGQKVDIKSLQSVERKLVRLTKKKLKKEARG